MTTLKWFLLAVFAVSAYWLWPIYVIVAFVVLGAMMPGSTSSRTRRSSKSRYKPIRIRPRRQTVYKTPRYPRPKPRAKGRLLKSGIRQHYRNGRWTPRAIKIDRPD